MKIKRIRLEDLETQAITGTITSTEFLKKIRTKLKPQHFKSYGGEVLKWVYEYFDNYNEAPQQEILRIHKEKKKRLSGEKQQLIALYLRKLSDNYERQSRYNIDYLYDKVIPFIRKRDIENLAQELTKQIESDRVEKASDALVKFQLVHKETSGVYNPFAAEYIDQVYDLQAGGILELPDALGQLIGPLDRNWLVSFTAPEKRGKTWWLIEMAFQAISQRRNVVFISLEMGEKEVNTRLWKRLTAAAEGKSKVFVPVFDCKYNQTNTCQLDERTSTIGLADGGGEITGKWVRGYKPCSYCRTADPAQYNTTFWYEKVRVNEYSKQLVLSRAANIEQMLGSNLRVKCFPAYSANMHNIRAALNELDVNEGFAADVLIDDYLDIHSPEARDTSERGNIDVAWKSAKGLAQEKSLLYITVDQSSKITYERDIRLYDTSEDKRKNAHLDAKIAMNRMPDAEAEIALPEDIEALRFSVIAHRHRSFRPNREVLVLQQRAIGQPLIDCAWYRR